MARLTKGEVVPDPPSAPFSPEGEAERRKPTAKVRGVPLGAFPGGMGQARSQAGCSHPVRYAPAGSGAENF